MFTQFLHINSSKKLRWQYFETPKLYKLGASKKRIEQYWRRWLGWSAFTICLLYNPS